MLVSLAGGGRRSAHHHHPKADRVRVRVSAFRVVSESTGIFCDSFFCTLGIFPLVSRNNSTIMTMPCPYGLSKLANLNESLLLGKHIGRNSGWRVESCVELRLFSSAAFFFSSYFFLPFSVQQYPQSRSGCRAAGCGLRALNRLWHLPWLSILLFTGGQRYGDGESVSASSRSDALLSVILPAANAMQSHCN